MSDKQKDEGSDNVRDINSLHPFRRAALEYYNRGFLPVPLPANEKHPPPKDTTGHHPAVTIDLSQINEWLNDKAFEKGNIGIKLDVVNIPGVGKRILVGIDVDDYTDGKPDKDGNVKVKTGASQLAELEAKFGKLPDTYITSSRTDGKSGIRWLHAPCGFNWMGKVSDSIELIQPGHRYAVVWPSYHPKGGQYHIYPPGEAPDGVNFTDEIPYASDVAELPEAWVKYLTRGYTELEDRPMDMSLSANDISKWASGLMRGGKWCATTHHIYEYWKEKVDGDPASHDKLLHAQWQMCLMGLMEGHKGIAGKDGALNQFTKFWYENVRDRDKRGNTEAKKEIFRSVVNAFRKIKVKHNELTDGGEYGIPACSCSPHISAEEQAAAIVEKDGLPPPPGKPLDVDEYEHSDWGRAELFLDLYTLERIKCVQIEGNSIRASVNWYLWQLDCLNPDKSLGWVQDNELAVRLVRAVGRAYRLKFDELYLEYLKLKELGDLEAAKQLWREKCAPYKKLYEQIGNTATIGNLLAALKNIEGVKVPEEYFDSNPTLLGFDDGVVVLEPGKPWVFRPKTMADACTRTVGRSFRPLAALVAAGSKGDDAAKAGIKLLNGYREQFVPDPELWNFISMILGYALYGANPDRVIFFFHGTTSTGKSTLLNAFMESLGPYAATASGEIFDDKDGGRNPELVKTKGKRFVQLPEFGEGSYIKNDALKRLASEDPTSVRDNYAKAGQIMEFQQSALFIGPTNSVPRINGLDSAVIRRIRAVPFDHSFPEEGGKMDLPGLLKTVGAEVVLAFALEGWNRYSARVAQGQNPFAVSELPEVVRRRTQQFTNEMSSIGDFVADYIQVTNDKKDYIIANRVYSEYVEWAEQQGIPKARVMDQRALSSRITSQTGLKNTTVRFEDASGKKGQARGWKGAKLTEGSPKFKSGLLKLIVNEDGEAETGSE